MLKVPLNIPNILTLSRILLIPVFVVLMYMDLNYYALAVFILASLTDYFDGFLARRFESVSDFGKLMDPIADKILVITALIMLVASRDLYNADPWVAPWMVVIIIARELWINGVRSMASAKGLIIAAGSAGKVKSFIQMLAIVFLILHQFVLFEVNHYRVTAQFIGDRLLLISIFFALWSAYEYTYQAFTAK